MKPLIFIAALFLAAGCSAPSSSPEEKRMDKIFSKWNKPGSPGAAVAVVKDGKIIFSKGYGMSNLEYNIPITPSSIFHIASESKQYTAFCLVLLAQDGKLDLNDDIRKYLPYVPDYGKTITIKNLIWHTSGIRDQWQTLAIGGEAIDDVITQQHVVKMMEMQRELNFDPGERMLYCNTGYTLMAEIVKAVSGKSLRAFADERIFKPLGMTNTHFHDDNTEVVPNRTYSYDRLDSVRFANAPLNYATVGATSLFTTVEDETKWLNNYSTGQVGGKQAIDKMYECAVLNNGRKLNYAFAIGIDTLKMDSLFGYQAIGHGGGDAGYRTYAIRFPEENLGVVVFSNLGDFSPYARAMDVAKVFLPVRRAPENNVKLTADSTKFSAYAGWYYSKEGDVFHIIDSGKLYLNPGDGAALLEPAPNGRFSGYNGNITIGFEEGSPAQHFTLYGRRSETLFTRFTRPTLTPTDLKTYVGVYESPELDVRYQIVFRGDSLVLRHRRYPDAKLTPITKDQFSTSNWWMENLLIDRDAKGNVTGFEVNSGRVLRLRFSKK